ncbi:ferredoxin [Bradyrhizobium yuanmingense]|uniref:Ferredoxin n=1 Tax=Bradyrhizobium yuanmingense TaxID=108015 RepID=A0ABV4GLW2_9BRAD
MWSAATLRFRWELGSLRRKGEYVPFKIIASQCTGCSACEPLCPNVAISEKEGHFVIEATKCTECVGHYDEPQCVAACPIDNTCVVDRSLPRYQAPG